MAEVTPTIDYYDFREFLTELGRVTSEITELENKRRSAEYDSARYYAEDISDRVRDFADKYPKAVIALGFVVQPITDE